MRLNALRKHADALICAALAGVAALRLWPMLTGLMPLYGDHMVHMYKSWFLWERLLPRGSFKGWSSMWFMGEPVGDLYPPGQDLWVVFWRALTLGQLSWEQTYGFAFVSYFALSAVALYEFGRRHLGRAAGLLAALLWLFDPGQWEEGGWRYVVIFGVWGQSLAMGLFLAGLSRTLTWMETGSRRHLGAAGLLFGVGHLCHPTNLLLAAAALPLLVLLSGRARPEEPRRAVGATLLGLAVGACFWLPFLARSDYAQNIGAPGGDPLQTLRSTLEGQPFREWAPAMGYLAALGSVVAAWRGRTDARLVVALYWALAAATGGVLTQVLHVQDLWTTLGNINFARLSMAAKPLGFLLIGLGVQASIGWLSEWRTRRPALQLRAGLGLTLSLWGALALGAWVRSAPTALDDLTFVNEWPEWSDYQAYLRWSSAERERSDSFYRVAYRLHRHDHRFMAAPMVNHTPILKLGYTPASMYAATIAEDEPGVLERASVRFLLTNLPMSDDRFTLLHTFGSLSVYTFKEYSPARYTLFGGGLATVRRFDDEAIAIELRGTDPAGRLVLHMGNFPRWIATINGVETPTLNPPLWRGGPSIGLGLPTRDGLTVLTYGQRGVDRGASWLSAAALGLCLGLMRRRPDPMDGAPDRV